MKNINKVFHVLAIAVVLGLLAACSGKAAPTMQNYTPASSTQASVTGSENSSAASDVTIKGFTYTPATLTIKVGTTVKWTNNDSVTHTVISDTGLFDSGELASGDSYSFTFTQAGTFAYHCAMHPGMVASIIVTN